MRLPSPSIAIAIILSKAAAALAQDEELHIIPPPPVAHVENGVLGPPADAPTDNSDAKGCKGMKFMLK